MDIQDQRDNVVVVTRHQALVDYLIEIGMTGHDTPVISHASKEAVAGKDVIGVLPLRLASVAASVTEVPLALGPEHRGRELTLREVRALAGEPVAYDVRVIADWED